MRGLKRHDRIGRQPRLVHLPGRVVKSAAKVAALLYRRYFLSIGIGSAATFKKKYRYR
jgi:hypothetical protein